LPASRVATTAVGSYPAFSPLPDPNVVLSLGRFVVKSRSRLNHATTSRHHHFGHRRCAFCCAGVGSLRLGVTQHPAL